MGWRVEINQGATVEGKGMGRVLWAWCMHSCTVHIMFVWVGMCFTGSMHAFVHAFAIAYVRKCQT